MESVSNFMKWVQANWEGLTLMFFVLTTILSEILAYTEKNNGILQLIVNILKKLGNKQG